MNAAALGAFLGVDVLLVLTPGADWAYAIAAGLRGRTVFPAVCGLMLGYIGHTLLLVVGVAALMAAKPGLLTIISVVGAAYLLWIGITTLLRANSTELNTSTGASSPGNAILRGVGVSGLNPKALLLFLAVLPQFVVNEASWPATAQLVVLALLHMSMCGAIYFGVGIFAREVLSSRPKISTWITRFSGVALILLALALLLEQLLG